MEGMRRRECLVKELGISEQVAASLKFKSVHQLQQSTQKVSALLTKMHNDNDLVSEHDLKTSDSEGLLRHPLSADIHGLHHSTKPYSESFCRIEPGYRGMGIQRSSSSQAISRPSSQVNSRHNEVPCQVLPGRPLYCFPQPQSSLHRVLTTYGPGIKSKGTSTSKPQTK